MSDYTPEQVERLATRMDAFPDDLPSVNDCITAAETLRAYAATLRQQGGMVGECYACEGRPGHGNSPCVVCGKQAALAQNTQGEAVAWALKQGGILSDWCNTSGVALRSLMNAYERRVRTECATPEDIAKQPWRCAEYVQAEEALRCKPIPTVVLHAERARVPDEMTQQTFREDDPERFGYVRGFNACRDLVLAAAPSQPKDAA